ncbi:hypothetical protein HGA91_02810 [candidate division WWE3 bacterium]|nr:hypothetical protein [candidate division WWE3 bacterium]
MRISSNHRRYLVAAGMIQAAGVLPAIITRSDNGFLLLGLLLSNLGTLQQCHNFRWSDLPVHKVQWTGFVASLAYAFGVYEISPLRCFITLVLALILGVNLVYFYIVDPQTNPSRWHGKQYR